MGDSDASVMLNLADEVACDMTLEHSELLRRGVVAKTTSTNRSRDATGLTELGLIRAWTRRRRCPPGRS